MLCAPKPRWHVGAPGAPAAAAAARSSRASAARSRAGHRAQGAIGAKGGIELLLGILARFAGAPEIVNAAICALRNVTGCRASARTAIDAGAAGAICGALLGPAVDDDTLSNGLAACVNLLSDPRAKDALADAGLSGACCVWNTGVRECMLVL